MPPASSQVDSTLRQSHRKSQRRNNLSSKLLFSGHRDPAQRKARPLGEQKGAHAKDKGWVLSPEGPVTLIQDLQAHPGKAEGQATP